MKILKIFFLTILAASVFYSCKEPEFASIGDQRFVIFSSNSLTVAEASVSVELNGNAIIGPSTIQVTVVRSASDLSSPLTVTIEATAKYLDDSNFADEGDDASTEYSVTDDLAAVVIPAGSASVTFSIVTVNDAFSKGNKEVTFTITAVSDNSYSIGNATLAKSGVATLKLLDDDCPIDLASFEGMYSLASFAAATNSANSGFDVCAAVARDCSGVVTLTADSSDPSGTSAILTHSSFGSPYGIKFVTCPKQIEVTMPLASWFGNPTWNMQQGLTKGTYNPDTKDITIIGLLSTFGEFTMELKKVN